MALRGENPSELNGEKLFHRARLTGRVWEILFKAHERMFQDRMFRNASHKPNQKDRRQDSDRKEVWKCESLDDLNNICELPSFPGLDYIWEGCMVSPGIAIVRKPSSYQVLPRIFSDNSIYGRVPPAGFPLMLEKTMIQECAREACCLFVGSEPMGVVVLNQSLTHCEPSLPSPSEYVNLSTHPAEEVDIRDTKKFIGPFPYKCFKEKTRERLETYGALRQFEIIEDAVPEHLIICFAYLDVGFTLEVPMILDHRKTISSLMADRCSAIRMQVNSVIWEHAEVLKVEPCLEDNIWDSDEEDGAVSHKDEVDRLFQEFMADWNSRTKDGNNFTIKECDPRDCQHQSSISLQTWGEIQY